LALPDVLAPDDPRAEVRGQIEAWLAFQAQHALQPRRALDLLRARGAPRPRGGSERRSRAALAALRRAGAVALPFASPAYPPRLAALPDAAPLLLVRGDPGALRGPCVAIVGARAATAQGRDVAGRLAGDLARAGVTVVSGLAVGIDAAAHRGALAAGGRTVAVQACGPDAVYPPGHRRLAAEIAAGGAVVTEFPPGTPPLRYHFPLRNRLISGLSRAVVVVEARLRSGSLGTAAHALEQGIEVFAVPGPVTSPTSAGSNRLLRDGARICLEADDVLRELALRCAPRRLAESPAPLPGGAKELLALLRAEPLSRDELAQRLGRAPQELALAVLDLELAGRLVSDRDGRLRVVSGREGGGDGL